MQRFARIDVIVLSVLFLSIAFKMFAQGASDAPSVSVQLDSMRQRLVRLNVQVTPSIGAGPMESFLASRGGCIYFIATASADGYSERFYTSSIPQGEKVSFVFLGEAYDGRQPRLYPFFRLQLYKLLAAMRIHSDFPTVFVVRSQQDCPLRGVFY